MSKLILIQIQCLLLAPVDMVLNGSECVTLSGASGSGKTLLLRAIADLDPHQGEILLGEESQLSMPAPTWRRRVGLLPTDSAWWGEQVGEHLPTVDESLLEAMGFDNSCLEWQVSRLSSGERQRLALVRLLSRRPEILLLDEPTANLDAENGRRVEQLIDQYRSRDKVGVIWVSHSLEQRKRVSSRGYKINDGRLEPEIWS